LTRCHSVVILVPVPALPIRRPAEASGLAGSVAILLAGVLGVTDPATIVALGVTVGALPAAVTWLVELLRRPKAGP
jgi:hypothetical protein